MTEYLPAASLGQTTAPLAPARDARVAAEKLEATFLSEMLKSSGLGEQDNSFSGGVGEDQFASFHRMILAEAMVQRGGIGLAEMFFQAMTEKNHDN